MEKAGLPQGILTPELLTAVVSLLGAELVWVTAFFFFFPFFLCFLLIEV